MFYGNQVQDTRQHFFISWHKFKKGESLMPLEQQLVNVIQEHPEYHAIFNGELTDQAYFPGHGATNPFLHLGLHLALRDQISTNRPQGITSIYQKLSLQQSNPLTAEHLMMSCLEAYIQHGNDQLYLAACQHFLHS